MTFITVENLKYRYPLSDVLALDDVSFTVKKGEFIGIIGANNAGKSTLCNAIAGIVPHFYKGAYGGKVIVGNLVVGEHEIADICQKVSIIFQNPFNQMTGAKLSVYEEIAFGLENLAVPRAEMKRRINEVMELLDIAKYRDRNPFSLSGGQMQRLALASVIVMQPDVLLLDEPTSQLDPQGTAGVFAAIHKLSKMGMTIFMVEHKMEQLVKYADKLLLLHQGKLIDYTSADKLFSRTDIVDYHLELPIYTKIAYGLKKHTKNGDYPTTLKELKDVL